MKKLVLAAIVALTTLGGAYAQPMITAALPTALRDMPTSAPRDIDFTVDIARAEKMLAGLTASYTLKSGKLKDFTILIAVKHVDHDEIRIVCVDKKGENCEDRHRDTFDFDIDWSRGNGVNTPFIVTKPKSGYVVLRIKRVIRSGKSWKEVTYTPYSPLIDTPAMRSRGATYLQETIQAACAGLTDVKSHAFPNRTICDAVPSKMVILLGIVEHVDPARSKREEMAALVNEVLVIVGANGPNAYAQSNSKSGARGLFQFMPGTYKEIVARYPEAKLKEDFVHGTRDHVNAAKAALLLFDSDLAHVDDDKLLTLEKDPMKRAEYLAAAYNTGASRAVRAIIEGNLVALREETRMYLVKLRAVAAIYGL